jgi:uncharacterized protein (TIGR02145 family)
MRRQIFTTLILCFLCFTAFFSHAQTGNILIKYVISGSSTTIKLDNTDGNIQWQESDNLDDWNNLPGQINDSLIYNVTSNKYIRAFIIYGNCNPYYSDIILIIAVNDIGCPEVVTDFDGNSYSTVQIGNQCWMAENLRVTKYPDGTTIPYVTSDNDWALLPNTNYDDAFCYFNNSLLNAEQYGALYTWSAAMGDHAVSSFENPSGVQGACPSGWHIPSDSEWSHLEMRLGMSWQNANSIGFKGTDEGSKIAGDSSLWENGDLESNSKFGVSGFKGLPSGQRYNLFGDFVGLNSETYWWSASESFADAAWYRSLANNKSKRNRENHPKAAGFSVRCVYDSVLTEASIPVLITTEITNITSTTASGSGNILLNGLSAISERGLCYNTDGNPSYNSEIVNGGLGTGLFMKYVTNLHPNTIYYVRAYAINNIGIGYGNELQFLTSPGLATVHTDSVFDISFESVSVISTVVNDGGFTISERGICWNTTGNPDINGDFQIDSTGTGVGSFVSSINDLIQGTSYFLRAYAINNEGLVYGQEIQFNTAYDSLSCPSTVLDYDGNSYNTIAIGAQCWMSENLKTTHYSNGIGIPHVSNDSLWDLLSNNSSDDAFCYFNDSSTNANLYGALYTWAAATGDNSTGSNTNPSGVQGVCPSGWHLPSDNEWKQLEIYLGMDPVESDQTNLRGTDQGSRLAGDSTLWQAGDLKSNGMFGSSDFHALPAGIRHSGGQFVLLNEYAYWWTSSESSNDASWNRFLSYYHPKSGRNTTYKSSGLSVRCLRDTGQIVTSPVVSTDSLMVISQTSAYGGGEVINNGGADIYNYGLCWNYSGSPTIADSNTMVGLGSMSFNTQLVNLIPDSIYFVRAFASNSAGTGYGNEIQFTIESGFPVIIIDTIINITNNSALCVSNILNSGSSPILNSGVCWNTTGYPTIADSILSYGAVNGVFNLEITTLNSNTTYFIRSYAENNNGVVYSDVYQIVTLVTPCPGTPFVYDYDGNLYHTVQIGNQCWLAENLKTTHYSDGTAIPYVFDDYSWSLLDANNYDDAYCWYNNDNTYSEIYGGLYTWAAAMGDSAISSTSNPSGVQGICPIGWHLPSSSEWNELRVFIGGTYSGGKLKEAGTNHWLSPNTGATNESEFTALPGGSRHYDTGVFFNIGQRGHFWSSSEETSWQAMRMRLVSNSNIMYTSYPYSSEYKSNGLSVRCVKD